jgi:GAF domain-containing protein
MGAGNSDAADDRRGAMHAFAELALITVNADPAEHTLHRVAELAKRSLGGVEDVSLTVIRERHPSSVIFTGQLAVDLDERQYELGFGPCLDAADTGQTILVDTGAVHSPYNEFARLAARAGVRHVVSVGLPLAQRSVGGLNIYCTADATPGPEFIEQAEVFASYAAVAVNNVASYIEVADDAANMRAAMASRAVIEQAKGIIMGRDHCTAEEAFDILRRISQQKNVKVRELSQAVVDSVKQ